MMAYHNGRTSNSEEVNKQGEKANETLKYVEWERIYVVRQVPCMQGERTLFNFLYGYSGTRPP